MDAKRDGRRVRSFVIGGVLGAAAAVAAGRKGPRRRKRQTVAGLAAFESAPCYREAVERSHADAP